MIEPVAAACLVSYCYLDHDQRNTLTTGAEFQLPWQSWFSTNVVYGSGFLKVDGPAHLPQHVTGDISFGKSIRERWSVEFTALNISNTRYLLGLDSTFGGTHYNDPREVIGSVRYRFHF
jgi:outer membrane receptor protein involved in Fe transport